METLVIGDGGLGHAIEAACLERGGIGARVVGRPSGDTHDPATLGAADVAFEASAGPAVVANIDALVAAGYRRIVIGTTGWDADREEVDDLLRGSGAAAVAAANFSLAAVAFQRVVEMSAGLFGSIGGFDPYIVEWHRRSKRDRPSGTARELARRVAGATKARSPSPRPSERPEAPGQCVTEAPEAPAPPGAEVEVEIAVIRAGSIPGTHLVGFEGSGEAVELRLVARDRTAYAAGALAAADWLLARPRSPGLHPFDAVIDDLLADPIVPGMTRTLA